MVNSIFQNDPLFRDFSPFTVGFDNVFKELSRVREVPMDGYPPYNITRKDEENFQIELAVAGFKEEDLDITLHPANTVGPAKLSIKGSSGKEKQDFDHRGIAARKFEKNFTLADNVNVDGVDLEYGLLKIDLSKVVPEDEKPIKFEIGTKAKTGKKEFLSEE